MTTQARVQRRTLATLSAAQILGGLGVGTGVAVGGLLAVGVTGSETAAGLASTANVVGAAAAALPLARLTEAHGRRAGLGTGLGIAAVGAALVVVGGAMLSTPLLFAGLLLTGAATAVGLQARYAATDLSRDDRRARDLSVVVWATTIGAVAGPNLADPAGRIATDFGLPELTGAYVLAVIVFVLASGVVVALLRPDPMSFPTRHRDVEPERTRFATAFRAITTRPAALTGLLAIIVAHTAMVSVMVMTPVHMAHVDVTIAVIGFVISVHIVGMYAFSPLVGLASDRFGRGSVLIAGCGLLLMACLIAGTSPPEDPVRLGIGLFLLGLGWSCGLVAGSTLLSESVPTQVRTASQGASDLLMNTSGAVGGVAAGLVVALASYGWLTVLAALPVLALLPRLLTTRRSQLSAAS